MPSEIEWTDETWNPVTGCTKISPGCKHCYALRVALWLKRMGNPRYDNGFDLTLHDDLLSKPLRWRKPKRVFVNSMSDLFHEDVPLEFIAAAFDVMVRCPQHTFQILTKRASRLAELAPRLPWPDNVWMGVSVEDRKRRSRIDHLRTVPARLRFLSCEPLLEDLGDLDLRGIHWVIVGGESGPLHRPIDADWVRSIRERCLDADVPLFFKQWGGRKPKTGGRVLDGRTYDAFPA